VQMRSPRWSPPLKDSGAPIFGGAILTKEAVFGADALSAMESPAKRQRTSLPRASEIASNTRAPAPALMHQARWPQVNAATLTQGPTWAPHNANLAVAVAGNSEVGAQEQDDADLLADLRQCVPCSVHHKNCQY
jgi:hypothetical protein